MAKTIIILLWGSLACSVVSSIIDIQCVCKDSLFEHAGYIRYCESENPLIIHEKNAQINIITNEVKEILGIRIQNQEIHYVPQFHKDFSAEFRLLSIIKSKLKEIEPEKLENFPLLKVLELSNNDIIYLDINLLKSNQRLKTFDISSNNIYAIHPSVFDSLKKLLYFNIRDNKCVSNVYDNPTSIKNYMSNLEINCSNELHSLLSQNYNSLSELRIEKSELLKKLEKVKDSKSKMSQAETITIVALGCVITALILYIIHKNCKKSSNQRFHSKVSHKMDMFEETSSICFSSTAGGLDDYPSRVVASNFNTINRNQSTLAEDGLPENTISEYADPILFTKHDIQQRQQGSSNYENSEVNLSQKTSNYQNFGQFSDGSDVRYQNYPFVQPTDNLKNLGKQSTLNIQDVDKRKQKAGQETVQYMNFLKGAASAESIGQAKTGTISVNSPQNIHKKSSESIISSQNTMTHSINDLSPTKQPESLTNSSNYDSSTQKSVKIAEIGRKTVKYTNISRAPSQDGGTDQSKSKLDQNAIQTSIKNPQIPRAQEYSSQFSTTSTGSIRRPNNIPNLQKPKFFDNINQKLQVITPRDNKPFEFPGAKSPGFSAQGQKDSLRSSQKKKSSSSSKTSFRSVGVHQSPTEPTVNSPKSPGSLSLSQKSFHFDRSCHQLPVLPGSIQNLPSIPDFVQNNLNSGTFTPKTSTAFSLNLSGNEYENLSDQKSPSIKSARSPNNENAPKLPNRNNLTLSSTKDRDSVNVDYCEPLFNTNGTELYSEPYSPNKITKK